MKHVTSMRVHLHVIALVGTPAQETNTLPLDKMVAETINLDTIPGQAKHYWSIFYSFIVRLLLFL